MFQAFYKYNEVDSLVNRTSFLDYQYVSKVGFIVQTQQLICSFAKQLGFGLKVSIENKQGFSRQEYVMIDENEVERFRLLHKAHSLMSTYASVVKYPMSIAQINRAIDKINDYDSSEKELEKFKELLLRLTHLNEEDFLIDIYGNNDEEDEDFSLMMQSKQGRQTVEVYI